jgi:hypothetical protein
MYGRIIAIPTGRKGDYLDFWSFIKDNGQTDIPNYAIRLLWNSADKKRTEQVLRQAKRDYYKDVQAYIANRTSRADKVSGSYRGLITAQREVDRLVRMDALQLYGM